MKRREKSALPQKLCVTCARPFVWRKKWATVWDEVRYCSQRCRRERTAKRIAPDLPGARNK
jgi:hypothetical protein